MVKLSYLSLVAGVGAVLVSCAGCADDSQHKREHALAQVQRVTEELDARTTETGAYERVDPKDLKEIDPWGTPLDVVYSRGGLAERVVVRSAGPDKEFHTADDIQGAGMSANLQGVGKGVRENVQEVAAETAKGAVKGTVQGIKESIKETFSRDKPGDDKEAESP